MAGYERYQLLSPHNPRPIEHLKLSHAMTSVSNSSGPFFMPKPQRVSSKSGSSRVVVSRDTLTSEMIEDSAEIGGAEGSSVCYVNFEKGMAVRHYLDFSSPRTKEAADRLGITFQDCIRRRRSEFFLYGVDQNIAKLRYEKHSKRVRDLKKAVFEKRKEMILRAERIAESKVNIEDFKKKPKYAASSVVGQPQIKIRPNERKAIKDFISKILLEKEINENKQQQNLTAKSTRCTEKNFGVKSKTNDVKEKAIKSSSSIFCTEDILSRQVEKRIEGARKLALKLREEQERKEEEQLLNEQEGEYTQSKLDNLERKMERAGLVMESRKVAKQISAAQSITAAVKLHEKVGHKELEKEEEKLANFFIKAEKIERVKKQRAERIAQLVSSLKLRNSQYSQKNQLEKINQENTYAIIQRDRVQNLELKMTRNRPTMSLTEKNRYPLFLYKY